MRNSSWPFPADRTKESETLAQARELLALERDIATEHCTVVVECYARPVPSSYPRPVYDATELEDLGHREPDILQSNKQELTRAVRYLDMRQLLLRPIPGKAHLVAFKERTE